MIKAAELLGDSIIITVVSSSSKKFAFFQLFCKTLHWVVGYQICEALYIYLYCNWNFKITVC